MFPGRIYVCILCRPAAISGFVYPTRSSAVWEILHVHDLDFRSTKLLVTYCTRLHYCIYICFSLCWPYNGPCYIFRFFFLPFLLFHFFFSCFSNGCFYFWKANYTWFNVCVDCAGQHLQKTVLVSSKEYKWPVVILLFSSSLWLNMIRNLIRPLQRESDSYTTIHRSFAGAGRLGGFYGRRENERRV